MVIGTLVWGAASEYKSPHAARRGGRPGRQPISGRAYGVFAAGLALRLPGRRPSAGPNDISIGTLAVVVIALELMAPEMFDPTTPRSTELKKLRRSNGTAGCSDNMLGPARQQSTPPPSR